MIWSLALFAAWVEAQQSHHEDFHRYPQGADLGKWVWRVFGEAFASEFASRTRETLICYEIKEVVGGGFAVDARIGQQFVGSLRATKLAGLYTIQESCRQSAKILIREQRAPEGRLYAITTALLLDAYHGRSIGLGLYVTAVAHIARRGGGLIMPDYCIGGGTSHAALLVWEVLKRNLHHEEDVCAIPGTTVLEPKS